MSATAAFLLHAGVIVAVILIITPLRAAAWWLLTKSGKPALSALKTVLHRLVVAHYHVARNFLPRRKVIYELSRERTSRRGEDEA